jgi:hypothetical protein
LVRTLQQGKDAANPDTRCSSSTLEMLRLLASLDIPREPDCLTEVGES